eukprot:m51a1_g3597 putative serine threonine kinase (898) ;mRNA; f:1186484-1198232
MQAKVCDFGLTIFTHKTAKAASGAAGEGDAGSLFWSSPEVLSGEQFTAKSDVFAFGVIVWETLARQVPYKDLNPLAVVNRVVHERLRPQTAGPQFEAAKPLARVMEQCWDQAPSRRPAFTEVIGLLEEASDMMADILHVSDAVSFAAEAQKLLVQAQWDPKLLEHPACAEGTDSGGNLIFRGLRVRIGIHVGEPDVDESAETGSSYSKNTRVDYIGPAVNKTARVAAAAKGGQVVLSTAAREELETSPGKVFQFGVLRDLGPVTFKGLNKTENIHEFVVANLERNFDNPNSQECYNRLAKESKPLWVIEASEISHGNNVQGKGSFGVVYKGTWRGQTVAIKKFFRQKVDSVTLYEIEHQIKEIAVLAEVRHPSILLFEVINEKALSMGQAVNVLVSVCNGMVYLHMSNIVHRDLKSTNILLNKKWDVKLSVGWMAPEVLKDGKYSESSDVFSLRNVPLSLKEFLDLVHTGLSSVHIAQTMLPAVQQWVNEFPTFMQHNGLSWLWIVNADETCVKISSCIGSDSKVLMGKHRPKTSKIKEPKGKFTSYLLFITSAGQTLFNLFIIPHQSEGSTEFPMEPIVCQSRGSYPTFWAFTDSGFMNSSLWTTCIKKLAEILANLTPSIKPVIVTDNMSAHYAKEALEWLITHGIYMFFLPLQVTHFMNPLDDAYFAILKQVFSSLVSKNSASIAMSKHSLAQEVISAAQWAHGQLTDAVIHSSFANVGLYSFNKELILTKAKLNLEMLVQRMDDTLTAQHATTIHIKCKSIIHKQLYLGKQLLKRITEVEAAKAGKAAAKLAAREEAAVKRARHANTVKARKHDLKACTCKGKHPGKKQCPRWQSSNKWGWCTTCWEYGLCPLCIFKHHGLLLKHEDSCGQSNSEELQKKRPCHARTAAPAPG